MKWEAPPFWTENLLQGSAFWMGYKTQLYRHYPLTEGAIVGEAVSLISGTLKEGHKLECEVMYKNLNVSTNSQKRADLVIKNNDSIEAVIEVKRAKSSNKKVEEDFKRLAKFHESNPSSRCFLLLVSQKFKPTNYINEKGEAVLTVVNGDNYIAKVRRACKAATSFKSKENAHYSCLIEVVSKKNI